MSRRNGPDSWGKNDSKSPRCDIEEQGPNTRPGPYLHLDLEQEFAEKPGKITDDSPWAAEPETGVDWPFRGTQEDSPHEKETPESADVPIRGRREEASAEYAIVTQRTPRKTPKPPNPPVDPNETWEIIESKEPETPPPISVEVPKDLEPAIERQPFSTTPDSISELIRNKITDKYIIVGYYDEETINNFIPGCELARRLAEKYNTDYVVENISISKENGQTMIRKQVKIKVTLTLLWGLRAPLLKQKS